MACNRLPIYIPRVGNCSSSCTTRDHSSYGECLKAKNLMVGWAASHKGIDRTREKRWDRNLENYRAARAQGIQPESTSPAAIRAAVEISNVTGTAYGG